MTDPESPDRWRWVTVAAIAVALLALLVVVVMLVGGVGGHGPSRHAPDGAGALDPYPRLTEVSSWHTR